MRGKILSREEMVTRFSGVSEPHFRLQYTLTPAITSLLIW